jgi:hypothetical protein
LPKILDYYNKEHVHKTTGMTPFDASKKENEAKIRQIYMVKYSSLPESKPKYRINQIVRLYRYKTIFEKGYTSRWTTELFKIKEVFDSKPPTYKLVDMKGEEILGKVYEWQISLHSPLDSEI